MSAVSGTHEPPITGEELFRRADLGPCELIDGAVVAVSPTGSEHGEIEVTVSTALAGFVRPRRLGRVLAGEVGIYTRRHPDRVRAADVLYISEARYARRTLAAGYLDMAPELVVEILSPRDAASTLTEKLREYFAIGVSLVWVVDPAARRVRVHRGLADVRELAEADRLSGEEILPGFELPVAVLFEHVT
jgi:Uma2 family endonuclease